MQNSECKCGTREDGSGEPCYGMERCEVKAIVYLRCLGEIIEDFQHVLQGALRALENSMSCDAGRVRLSKCGGGRSVEVNGFGVERAKLQTRWMMGRKEGLNRASGLSSLISAEECEEIEK